MSNEIITTLHPDQDPNTNLYPNIKKDNIPSNSIDRNKLDDSVNSLLDSINELKPSGVDTSTNILAFTKNNGIYIGSDTGKWYYWDGTQYVEGGTYQSTAIADGSITTEMLNNDCLIKYPYLNNDDLNNIVNLGRYIVINCTNTPSSNPFMLEIQRYKSARGNTPWVVQIAIDINTYQKYYRVLDSNWNDWYEIITNNIILDYDNLVDDNKILDNKFINWTNGNVADSDEYRLYNDYIEINNDIYLALFNENNGIFLDDNYAILGAYYDQNKDYLDEIYISNSVTRGALLIDNIYKLTPPSNTKYFRFSVKDKAFNYKWMVNELITKYKKYGEFKSKYFNIGGLLQDKTIVNFGDSIIGNTRDNTSVSSIISLKTGSKVYNIGFGGCKMSKHAPNWDLCSMYNIAKDIVDEDFTDLLNATSTGWSGMPSYFENTAKILSEIDFSKVDLITISYGTNDYRDGNQLVGNDNINIFDGDFDESGFINVSTGDDAESSGYKRTSKYYPIKSVSNLYLNLSALIPTFAVLFYDFNGNYLGYSSHNSSSLKYTLSVPSGAVCYRVYTEVDTNVICCLSYDDIDNAIAYYNFDYVIDSLKYSIRLIQNKYPHIKIIVTTPIYRSFLNDNNDVLTNSDISNFGGGTLLDYSKEYIKACDELKINCIDLYNKSQLNKETRSQYYPVDDGTHPNDKGRNLIATLISSEIIKIMR